MKERPLLIELRCNCGKYYLHCHKRGNDFRCDKCRKGMTAEEVEKELEQMPPEEYIAFMEEIAEYEREHGPIDKEDE